MIDPTFMTAVEWTDRMSLLLPDIYPLKIEEEREWKVWARHVLQSSQISQHNPPQPDLFADWREWASRFNQTVPTL